MGLRGPAPKPTALKQIEGNPGKRPLPKNEPKPKAASPKCPAFLDSVARREWRRLVPILQSMRVLTEADTIALQMYCELYARWRKAEADVDKTGTYIKSPNGYIQQSPAVSVAAQYRDKVFTMLKEFGLTPASRTRVAAEQEQTPKGPSLIR